MKEETFSLDFQPLLQEGCIVAEMLAIGASYISKLNISKNLY